MQTDKERLADWLGQWLCQRPEDLSRLAQNLLDKGVTLPPAPVDPAWFEDAVTVILRNMVPANYTVANPISIEEENTRRSLRALLAAGYRIIPPTQDRAAVIEKAETWTGCRGWRSVLEALYDAGMLVEGDGR